MKMKKNILIITIIAGLCYVVLASNTGGYGFSGHGDATGASGAGTGTNQGCSCHTPSANLAVFVELDSAGTAVTTYKPGVAYTIKISATNNSTSTLPYFGFQLACVAANSFNAGGANTAGSPSCVTAGTWGTTLPTSVRMTSSAYFSEQVIEQSTPIIATTGTGGTGTTYVESIPWTAPAAGTGAVVIYGVLNAVNHDGTSGGDMSNVANNILISETGHVRTCN